MTGGLAVLWTARRGGGPWDELASEYATRIRRFVPLDEVRLRPEAGRGGDPARALAREAEAVRRHLAPGDVVFALDERGRERTTEQWATVLERHRDRGLRTAFVIGSDLGLDATLRDEAHEQVALSKLTLPHQLVRVMLLEQLYRCCDLLAGGGYHRG